MAFSMSTAPLKSSPLISKYAAAAGEKVGKAAGASTSPGMKQKRIGLMKNAVGKVGGFAEKVGNLSKSLPFPKLRTSMTPKLQTSMPPRPQMPKPTLAENKGISKV